MNRVPILSVCLWTCLTPFTNAQPQESLKPSAFTFRLARMVLKDGTAREGWFLGTFRDSIVIQVGTKSKRYSRHDLLRVDIDAPRDRGKTALVGMVAGAYLGTALLMRDKEQPTPFFDRGHSDVGGVILPEALFMLAGGGLSYLVGAFQGDDKFDFTGTEEENTARWEELSAGGPDAPHRPAVHLSAQGSWVSGPLPSADVRDQYYYHGYDEATPLNLLRRIQLTYSVTNFLDVGIAAVWLGQPPLHMLTSFPQSTQLSLEMNGSGLYAVGVIQPLWKLGWRDVQWDIGAGVGIARIDFKATSQAYEYYTPPSPTISIDKKKSTISAQFNTELKVYITEYFSLGLTADLVYIPEEVPDVPGISFESRTLGTTSIGFVLGVHI